jgi:uncharacterized membrane protein YcaP (DUF421 family)
MPASITPFDWQRLLFSDNAPLSYHWEVVVRCVFTYLFILGALRITGRRQVKQLSLFELSIVLGLGSVAGDTMFYPDVPLAHAALTFGVVMGMYLLFNHLTEWYPKFSDWLEGKPILLVQDGQIEVTPFDKQNLTHKELFGQLRQHQVEHLGQVRRLYIEATGEMSVFFYPEDAPVLPGLPIFPEGLAEATPHIAQAGPYACCHCGRPQTLAVGVAPECPRCRKAHQWLPVCTAKRVT